MDFERLLIKEFEHWKLYLHQNQAYLGRCYLWAKGENNSSLASLSDNEWLDLRHSLFRTKSALTNLFNPSRFELHQMGNEAPHIHVHFVPRYSKPRNFAGIVFLDERWPEAPYAPYNKDFKIPDMVLERIKNDIAEKLDKS